MTSQVEKKIKFLKAIDKHLAEKDCHHEFMDVMKEAGEVEKVS